MMSEQKFIFTKNKRGKDTLIYKDHRYNLSSKNKTGSSRWRCVMRSDCSSTITLNKQKTSYIRKSKHTCSPCGIKNKMLMALNECKVEVCETSEPVQKIFEKKFETLKQQCSSDDVEDIPNFSSVKSGLYDCRRKFLNSKKLDFKKIQDVHVPPAYGKDFLICEDGDDEKIIIFCSKQSKLLIKDSSKGFFFGDGTFACVPRVFYQLYTIHIDLYSDINTTNVIPIIYGLLPNKSQDTYTRFFKLIKENLGVVIENYKCDYEIAAMNAIQSVFPNCQLSTCYYHYNKNIWKKAKSVNLTYSADGRNLTRMASLLPLLPYNHIVNTWYDIINLTPRSDVTLAFKKYYEEQWLKLDPNILSCAYLRHRTTNSLEGWHRRVNARISKRPTFFAFVHGIKKEATHYDYIIKKSLFLPLKKNRRLRDIKFDKELNNLLQQLEEKEISCIDYLKKIIYKKLKY